MLTAIIASVGLSGPSAFVESLHLRQPLPHAQCWSVSSAQDHPAHRTSRRQKIGLRQHGRIITQLEQGSIRRNWLHRSCGSWLIANGYRRRIAFNVLQYKRCFIRSSSPCVRPSDGHLCAEAIADLNPALALS